MRWQWCAAAMLLAASLQGCAASRPAPATVSGISGAALRLTPDWARLADAPPELRKQVASSPFAFFRFVNRAWTREVCEAFAADAGEVLTVRLHGDAHLEQYALTATSRGLDDFDDSARGPAVVDIVRFLGSLELVARQRDWLASLPSAIDAFFSGYRRALRDPAYLPPEPAFVPRLRAQPVKSPTEFLAWADSLVEPPTDLELAQLEVSWIDVETFVAQSNPEFTPAFMKRKHVGWLRMGIGSALTRKLLVRVEGPSPALDDDLVLEAKEIAAFDGASCVSIPPASQASRQVDGLRQMGRFPQRLLVALPGLAGTSPDGIGWWLRTWDRFYREVDIADLDSPDDLRELAHDVGAQLGSTNLLEPSATPADTQRRVERRATRRLELRIRQVARDLTAALLQAWQRGMPQ